MDEKPIVTVAVCAYNSEKYISRCIVSLLNQNIPFCEIVIIDDGSTDTTLDIIETFTEIPNVRYATCTDNKGIPEACNNALEIAQGKYFVRLDSDSFAFPTFAFDLAVQMRNYFGDIVYSDYIDIYEDEIRYKSPEHKENFFLLQSNGVMYETEKLKELGGYSNVFWEEHDLHIRLKESGTFFTGLKTPLWVYMKTNKSLTRKKENRDRGWKELEDKFGIEKLREYGYWK